MSELGIQKMQEYLDYYIDEVNLGNRSFTEALDELVEIERKHNQTRREQANVKTANFPFIKTVEDFDFDFQPDINKKEILEQLVITLAPFAPHVCEELWDTLGHETSVCDAAWPAHNEEYLKEDTINYTISFNGKARFNMEFDADAASDAIQAAVLADERSQKWIEGKTPKKIIVVPKKIVNVVV